MSGEEISKFVCKGNADAEQFCKSFVRFCHVCMDDILDRDKRLDPEEVAHAGIDFILQLSTNPFFLAHKAQLVSLIVQGFRAWADSNQSKYNENPTFQQACERDVIKGWYHECVFHVAAIVGGWSHLTEVTKRFREYDFEPYSGQNLPRQIEEV